MVWQQEHRLSYEDFLEKYRIIIFLFAGLFLLLSFRLFYLQVIRGRLYRTISEQQRTHIILERAPRGTIYDRNDEIIVGSKTSFVALFYPFTQESRPPKETLAKLGKILPGKDLAAKLTRGWRSGQVVRLAENLSRSEMFQILEQRLVNPGISVVKEARRDYRAPEFNAHLIGYLSEISRQELESTSQEGYRMGDWVGRSGLERNYDSLLRGHDGGWQIEVDAVGRQTRIVRHIPSKVGSNLHTTIDVRLQEAAGEGLRKTSSGRGAAVALDPRSGAVRALVSAPGFDPASSGAPEFRRYLVDKDLPLFNRTVQALYPPGSTFKVITFAAALMHNRALAHQTYHCNGKFSFGNKVFGCWEKKGHGSLSLVPALAKSCNVYFYQIGLKAGSEIVQEYARKFHLGQVTGVEISSEKTGLVPSDEWKRRKMKEPWHPGDTINLAIGQGPLWVTPMQMASVASTIANRGTIYQPYIVESIKSPAGETIYRFMPRKKGEVSMPADVWQLLHKAMGEVVENGTSRACYFPDLRVAGKTGTAQNPHGKDHAWFIGFGPIEDPQMAVAVVVENGGGGGAVAAPIARDMFAAMFGKTVPGTQVHAGVTVSTNTPANVLDEPVH